MKSSFKFLDSYTKEDRDIFFDCEREIEERDKEYISPLQGFDSYCAKRWTLSIAKIFSAYSAIKFLYHFALKFGIFSACTTRNFLYHFALKFGIFSACTTRNFLYHIARKFGIFCAYSAVYLNKMIALKVEMYCLLSTRNLLFYALKGLHIIEQDNVLLNRCNM